MVPTGYAVLFYNAKVPSPPVLQHQQPCRSGGVCVLDLLAPNQELHPELCHVF